MPDLADPTEPPPTRQGWPDWLIGVISALIMLAALVVYVQGALIASEKVNTNPERGNQMAYLQYAFKLRDQDWGYKQERNRMPALPMLLALRYEEDWGSDLSSKFFPPAKNLCLVLSVVCLGAVAAGCSAVLGWRSGLLLTLVLAFTLYLFRAAYVQAEVLYYTSSGLAFVGALVLVRRPSWWLGLGLGLLFGLTHLVKASILPAVALTVVVLAGRQLFIWWKARQGIGAAPVKSAALLWPIVLVPVAYLVTISPYLLNSKAIYGHAFYNVNSTFYMWQNSFQESKAFSSKYNDRRGYPSAPPDEIPSARKYFTTTPPAKIWGRLTKGVSEQFDNLARWYGAGKYLIGLLVAGCVLSWPVRTHWREGIYSHGWELVYALGYLLGYGLLISFYSAIARGPRFTFTLYLPLLFLLIYWITRLPEWRPAWFNQLRLPSWVGFRVLGVILLLITLIRDTSFNLREVLPKLYTGT